MSILANSRWEKFAQFVASGESGAAAYRKTYDARGASAEGNASRLIRNDKVKQRMAELQAQSATAAILTMQQRREIAREIALDTKARNSDRLAAIMADAKLAGELRPEATVNVGVTVQPPDALLEKLRAHLCAAEPKRGGE